jgi:hypothetical protein
MVSVGVLSAFSAWAPRWGGRVSDCPVAEIRIAAPDDALSLATMHGGKIIAEREDIPDSAVLVELAYGWQHLKGLGT